MTVSLPNLSLRKLILWLGSLFLIVGVIFFILVIRGDFPRFRSQLAKLPVLHALISQRDAIAAQSKVTTLNYFIPSFDYLVEFIEQPGIFKKERLHSYNGYIDYYERVIDLYPTMAEGYGMLGFLYFQDGDLPKARQAYEKAIVLNPGFFWLHYDLGILYCKDRQYRSAETEFKRALVLAPENSLKFIVHSKIYQQIILQKNFQYNFQNSLVQAYLEIPSLLQLCSRNKDLDFTKSNNTDAERLMLKIF